MSDKWTWETAHLSPGAGVVVVKKIDGEWHTFAMWARGGYDIPKGHLEDGDTYLETAIRECEEECGINDLNFLDLNIFTKILLIVFMILGKIEFILFIYLIKKLIFREW